jgi:hypothetical protein
MSTPTIPAHDRYGCSSSSRWLTCPGSIEAIGGRESASSAYANEGTAAHELAAALLTGTVAEMPTEVALCNRCSSAHRDGACGQCGSPEYRLDREMPRHLATYVDYLLSLRLEHEVIDEGVEARLQSDRWPEHGGTCDWWAVYREGKRTVLHVVDLKYGQGTPVAAESNTQLMCYVLLLREQFPFADLHFRGTIVQPRVGEGLPSTVDFTRDELDTLELRIADAYLSRHLVPGDHCRWCPAAATCPALSRGVEAALEDFGGDLPADLAARSAAVQRWLELLPAMRHMVGEVPKLALTVLREGGTLDGWKAVQSWGNRSWSGEPEAIAAALEGRGVDPSLLWESSLRSPTQIEKLTSKAAVEGLTQRPARGYAVVVTTDKRPSVDLSADDFTTLNEVSHDE